MFLVDASARTLDESAVVRDDRHIYAECLSHRQSCLKHASRRNRHHDPCLCGTLYRCNIFR